MYTANSQSFWSLLTTYPEFLESFFEEHKYVTSFGFFETDDSKGFCDRNQWLNQINQQQITCYNLNVPHFESGLFHLGT